LLRAYMHEGTLPCPAAFKTEFEGVTMVHLVTKPCSRTAPNSAGTMYRAAVRAQQWTAHRFCEGPALGMGRDRRTAGEMLFTIHLLQASKFVVHGSAAELRIARRSVAEATELGALVEAPWNLVPPGYIHQVGINPGRVEGADPAAMCVICMEAVEYDVFTTLCPGRTHTHHRTCLANSIRDQYFPESPVCPIDRHRLSRWEVVDLVGDWNLIEEIMEPDANIEWVDPERIHDPLEPEPFPDGGPDPEPRIPGQPGAQPAGDNPPAGAGVHNNGDGGGPPGGPPVVPGDGNTDGPVYNHEGPVGQPPGGPNPPPGGDGAGGDLLDGLEIVASARHRAELATWGTPVDGARVGRVRQAVEGLVRSDAAMEAIHREGLNVTQVLNQAAEGILERGLVLPEITPAAAERALTHNRLVLGNTVVVQGMDYWSPRHWGAVGITFGVGAGVAAAMRAISMRGAETVAISTAVTVGGMLSGNQRAGTVGVLGITCGAGGLAAVLGADLGARVGQGFYEYLVRSPRVSNGIEHGVAAAWRGARVAPWRALGLVWRHGLPRAPHSQLAFVALCRETFGEKYWRVAFTIFGAILVGGGVGGAAYMVMRKQQRKLRA